MSSEKSFYRSGELAELAGVSTDTLRHYERKGVLARPLREANDYRQYPASALRRVRLIRRAIAVGFTLNELASVLDVRDSGGAPCMEVRALAVANLSEFKINREANLSGGSERGGLAESSQGQHSRSGELV